MDEKIKRFFGVIKESHRDDWKFDRYLEGWDDAVDFLESEFEKIFTDMIEDDGT